jgi:hypothetical protein
VVFGVQGVFSGGAAWVFDFAQARLQCAFVVVVVALSRTIIKEWRTRFCLHGSDTLS